MKQMTEEQMMRLSDMLYDECWVLLSSAEVEGSVTHLRVVDPPDAPDAKAHVRELTVEGTTPEEVMESLRTEGAL